MRKELAVIKGFQEGKFSFLTACEKAGVSAFEFLDLVKSSKTVFIHISEFELEQEIALARK